MSQSIRAFTRELRKQEPLLAQAFSEAIQDIRSASQMRALEAAIERGDIDGAFQAIRLGKEFFAPLDAQIEQAFRVGGFWQMSQMPEKPSPEGLKLEIRFDQRNPRAEQWVRQHAGARISQITEDQRTLIRKTIEAGVEDGLGAKAIARNLLGVKSGNQRVGALIGLLSREAQAVQRARVELAEGDYSAYFRRERRDKRFDAVVRKAQKSGDPIAASQIEAMTRRYADRLLQTRAQRIARTEAHNAMAAGRYEAAVQMVESGQVPASAVKLTWQATISDRTRDSHLRMDEQTVGFGEAFTSPETGAQMRFPGDSSLGAPASETVNCRCGMQVDVDFTALAR